MTQFITPNLQAGFGPSQGTPPANTPLPGLGQPAEDRVARPNGDGESDFSSVLNDRVRETEQPVEADEPTQTPNADQTVAATTNDAISTLSSDAPLFDRGVEVSDFAQAIQPEGSELPTIDPNTLLVLNANIAPVLTTPLTTDTLITTTNPALQDLASVGQSSDLLSRPDLLATVSRLTGEPTTQQLGQTLASLQVQTVTTGQAADPTATFGSLLNTIDPTTAAPQQADAVSAAAQLLAANADVDLPDALSAQLSQLVNTQTNGSASFTPQVQGQNPALIAFAGETTALAADAPNPLGTFLNSANTGTPGLGDGTFQSPAQQLAQLLSDGGAETLNGQTQNTVNTSQLANLAQLNLPQAPTVLAQPGGQPLAQFQTAALADDTLPAFTAQLSRNVAAGRDTFNIRLNPSELGRVDVRLFTNEDGSVNAQVRVERAETLDLFQRDVRTLERNFLQSGLRLGSEGIDLSLSDNGQNGSNQAFDGNLSDGQGERANSDPLLAEETALATEGNDSLLVEDINASVSPDVVQTIYARFQPGQLNIRV